MLIISPSGEPVITKEAMDSLSTELLYIITDYYDSLENQEQQEEKNMNAVIFARYSSEAQNEESIDAQIRVCMEYAKRNGMTVIRSYIDRAMTGRNDRRPQFQEMIKATAQKNFQVILIWKFDRFARDRYDASVNKHIAKKNGVKVISVTESIPDDPTSIILESVTDSNSEYYACVKPELTIS
jgi:predicted site-specific integrase-resolvase